VTEQGGLQECWRGTQNLSSSRSPDRRGRSCTGAGDLQERSGNVHRWLTSVLAIFRLELKELAGVLGQCPGLAHLDLNLASELTGQRWGSADITCEIYNILMNVNKERKKLKVYTALAYRDLRSNGSDQTGRASLHEC